MSVMEGVCNGEESELTAQACVLSEFTESAEARALFSSLPDTHHDTASREAIIEKFVGKNDFHLHDVLRAVCLSVCLVYLSIYPVCLSMVLCCIT